jgi:hypothetical protein
MTKDSISLIDISNEIHDCQFDLEKIEAVLTSMLNGLRDETETDNRANNIFMLLEIIADYVSITGCKLDQLQNFINS